MPQKKVKNHTIADMYKAWCALQLKAHPNYYDGYDYFTKSPSYMGRIRVIYKNVGDKKIIVMNYMMFRNIIELYNKYAADAIIHGHRFDLGSKLGYLFAARIERNLAKPKFDVISTMAMRRVIPDHPPIYHITPDYCMVKWKKLYAIVNESVYCFITANHTFRTDFSIANKRNPVLKTNYKFIPVQQKETT